MHYTCAAAALTPPSRSHVLLPPTVTLKMHTGRFLGRIIMPELDAIGLKKLEESLAKAVNDIMGSKAPLDGDPALALADSLRARVTKDNEATAAKLHEEWVQLMRTQGLCAQDGVFILAHMDASYYEAGLEALIGPPDTQVWQGMLKEHLSSKDSDIKFYARNYGTTTTPRIEWHFVTNPEAGLKACGISAWPSETRNMDAAGATPRTPRSLEDLDPDWKQVNLRLRAVGVAPLLKEELVALRLYLGPMYMKCQAALRVNISHKPGQEWRVRYFDDLNCGNPYTNTIHVVSSAIVRLSKLHTTSSVLYAGLTNGILPDFFWRAEQGRPRGGTEIGFQGTTTDLEVAMTYAVCNGSAKRGTLLTIQVGALDSGAQIDWLAQYPHEKEVLLPPLCFFECERIEVRQSAPAIPVLNVVTRLRVPSVMLKQPLLTEEESAALATALEPGRAVVDSSQSKFTADVNSLISGQPAEAARGLAHFMQVDEAALRAGFDKGTAAIVAEVEALESAELSEHLRYVLHEAASERAFPNGVRDKGRQGERLADFVNHPIAVAHGLDEARVAALRLYTTAAYSFINNPLRAGEKHPLPCTVAFIADGIKKLRAKRAEGRGATQALSLWRGMRNLHVKDDFLAERRGGTELAPCSTTTDVAVAAAYSASAESLLFKFRVGNFMQYGAELQWLSAFPAEAEVLYPPLTYLQPTGRVERLSIGKSNFTVVEVEPHLS